MASFITWLFRTKSGNAVGITALVLLCWWGFSSHYKRVGAAQCEAAHAAAVAKDNIKVVDQQNKRDDKSGNIEKATDAKAAEVIADTDTKTNETKEIIHVVYKDRIKTVPVAAGSCVHPVDTGVQHRIESAYDQAYGPSGRL